jgi:uncharacterized protein YtpQ (UPF0354 family)
LEYFQRIRNTYLEHYRGVLRSKRAEGVSCSTEVWIQPNVPPGGEKPPHPLCVDLLIQEGAKPSRAMVAGELKEGPLIEAYRSHAATVRVYETTWENFPVWTVLADPDWQQLQPWRDKWMDVHRQDVGDEDGLKGIVHHLGKPIAEGGGFLYIIDFGSAPVEALLEILAVLEQMGATELELGRSDGSDLPAETQARLRDPDLSQQELTGLVGGLVGKAPGIERVEQADAETLKIFSAAWKEGGQIHTGNLYRLLRRTGIEARAKEVYRFVRGQRETCGPKAPADLSQLRPVIKDTRFLANVKRLSPSMKPLLTQSLAADLWIVCVWDEPNGMRFATQTEGEPYGLTPEQLLDRAKTNFLKERPAVELSRHGDLQVAQTRDCYDASLLLDESWCAEFAATVEGDLLACVPSRNMLLLGDSACTGIFSQFQQAAERIESGGDHLISGTLLVWREKHWEAYRQPVTGGTRGTPATAVAPVVQPPPKRPWWRFW